MAITKSFFEEKIHKFAATAAIETFVIGADAKSVALGKHIAGDTIAIEGFAGEFSISRVGGKLTLASVSGQTITMRLVMPASGTNTATLQFLDGTLVLTRGTDGQVTIGTMNVTSTAQAIDDTDVSGTTSRALIDAATAPAQLPDAEYTLTGAASVNEGDTIIFTLDTKNVAPGSILNYTLSGISGSDINGPLSGTAVVDNLGKALIEVKVAADQLTEAVAESLTVSIVGTSATKSAAINDTSMTPGQTLRLSTEDDIRVGTDASDTFKGRIGTVGGNEANTLNSGDFIDGQGGRDTLEAQVFSGSTVGGGWLRPIQPEITDVEVIKLEAQYNDLWSAGSAGGEDHYDDVFVRASEITGVDELWSNNSTADLVIQDLTTKDSDGSVRDTSAMTIGMAYTGNSDHDWDQSDYKVYFDQDYLTPGVELGRPTVDIDVMNEDAYDATNGLLPLAGVVFGQFDIKVNNNTYSLVPYLGENPAGSGSEIQTYGQLLTAVQSALNALKLANPGDAALQTVTAALDGTFTSDNSRVGQSLQLTIAGETNGAANTMTVLPADLELIRADGAVVENNNRYERSTNNGADSSETPVTINVALEKVGLSGDGGNLVIGSMNKDAGDNNSVYQWDANGQQQTGDGVPTYNETRSGFEKFNVTVIGDASKPSSVASLRSTNNTLQTVVVESDGVQRAAGNYADLIIGNRHATDATYGYGLQDVKRFDSTAFKADATISAVLSGEMNEKYESTVGQAYNVNYDFGAGNDTLSMDIAENTGQGMNVSITMGEGDDTAIIRIDGDAVDASSESFSLALGNGDNTAMISVVSDDAGMGEDVGDDHLPISGGDTEEGVGDSTTAWLKNLEVTSGTGMDSVTIMGNGEFDIHVGANSDFVYIDTDGSDSVDEGIWLHDGDTLYPASTSSTDSPGDVAEGIAMYGAKLQVRYAGFEQTVDLDGGSDMIVTRADINNAILKAIEDNPELSRLISAELETADQNLILKALIEGENQAEVLIYQPQLVTSVSDAEEGAINIGSWSQSQLDTMAAALIATGRASDSADIDDNTADDVFSAVEIAEFFATSDSAINNEDEAGPFNTLAIDTAEDLNGTFWTSTYLTGGNGGTGSNSSVINMGAGANDLVVLGASSDSENTLEFDAVWGKVSVVNWFNDGSDTDTVTPNWGLSDDEAETAQVGQGPQLLNGTHKLDFTHWLKNEITPSGSTQSEELIEITVDDDTATTGSTNISFDANKIVFVRVDQLESAANPDVNLSFSTLSADQVEAALNASDSPDTTDFEYTERDVSDGTATNGAGDLAEGTVDMYSLLFVENVDSDNIDPSPDEIDVQEIISGVSNYANYGDYKVYLVSYGPNDGDASAAETVTDGFDVTYIGQIDFGASLDLNTLAGHLVGGTTAI